MPVAEGVALLVQDPVGGSLKMLLDLPPIFHEHDFAFFKLLAHAGAGTLQSGIIHIKLAALTVKGAAFFIQAFQFLFLVPAAVLQSFKAQVEQDDFSLTLLAYQEKKKDADEQATGKAQDKRAWLQLRAELIESALYE